MNILAIDTTGASASVAVINEQGIASQSFSDETLNHLSFLMPLVSEALEKCGLSKADIDVIAASEGPGSFTGIRIGVSSARALAQSFSLPCMGIPTLKTFLYNLENDRAEISEGMSDRYAGTVFCPLFDARRSQVYGGAYVWAKDEKGRDTIKEAVEGRAYTLEEILELLGSFANGQNGGKAKENCGEKVKRIIFFGDGINAYGVQIEKWRETSLNDDIQTEFAEEEVRYQNAASVAKLAMKSYSPENTCSYNELKPNYMRKAEAQRKLEEAKAAEKRSQSGT